MRVRGFARPHRTRAARVSAHGVARATERADGGPGRVAFVWWRAPPARGWTRRSLVMRRSAPVHEHEPVDRVDGSRLTGDSPLLDDDPRDLNRTRSRAQRESPTIPGGFYVVRPRSGVTRCTRGARQVHRSEACRGGRARAPSPRQVLFRIAPTAPEGCRRGRHGFGSARVDTHRVHGVGAAAQCPPRPLDPQEF